MRKLDKSNLCHRRVYCCATLSIVIQLFIEGYLVGANFTRWSSNLYNLTLIRIIFKYIFKCAFYTHIEAKYRGLERYRLSRFFTGDEAFHVINAVFNLSLYSMQSLQPRVEFSKSIAFTTLVKLGFMI